MTVNTGSKYTNFSNVEIGTSSGGGGFKVAGIQHNLGALETVTAGKTCTTADHGKILLLGDAAPGDVTLPAVTNTGFYIKIMCNFAITSNSVVTSAEGDNISGILVVNGASVPAADEDFINFIANTAIAGDWVELLSDGTRWLVNGVGNAAGSLTATDPA